MAKINVTRPVTACNKAGVSSPDVNMDTIGVYNNGTAATCNRYSPWVVSPEISLGYAAFVSDMGRNSTACCACFRLRFLDALWGKSMVVQVINSGTDLDIDAHFDIQIPGGGVGLRDGCQNQWNYNQTWGYQYGGVRNVTGCSALPRPLQRGCECAPRQRY